MSKFIDKLNRLSRTEPQPIGFRTAQSTTPKPKIQLVARLTAESSEDLVERVIGADAGLLPITGLTSGAKTLQKISKAMPDIPWGVRLEGKHPGKTKPLSKTSGDFIVFPASTTPLTILENSEAGKILEVEASLDEGLLRAAGELPIDAVLVTVQEKESYVLTWQHLMRFRRFADLLTTPLLVSIPSEVTAGELQALWEAGVHGVVVEITVGQPQDRLKKLRQIIDKLTFPSPHQRGKTEALLPRTSQEPDASTAEEDEEEY